MKPLEVLIEKNDNQLLFKLSGPLNAEAKYPDTPLSGFDTIVFDLSQITLINSSGIKEWVQFISKVPPDQKVEFINVASRFIMQLNLFAGLIPIKKYRIVSFFAPYYCQSCESSFDKLLCVDDLDPSLQQAPKMSCPFCNAREEVQFDGIEKKYFLFLKQQERANHE